MSSRHRTRKRRDPRAESAQLIKTYRSGQFTKTLNGAQEFVKQWPDLAVGWNLLGAAAQGLERAEQAVQAYRRANKLEPGNPATCNNLGLMLATLGHYDEAQTQYRAALRVKADFAEARYNLALALESAGVDDAALSEYRELLRQHPTFADAHNRLANLLARQERTDEAVLSYQRALELQPRRAEFHSNLGNALAARGDSAEAEACYRRSLELQPDFAEAYGNLGNVLRDLGRAAEAEEAFRRALEIRPDLAWVLDNLGNALADRGDFEGAIAAYQRALEVQPGNAVTRYHLALVKHFDASDSEIDRLEADLTDAHLSANDRIHLSYAAGKACADAGESDRAFAHYLEGARIKRAGLDYDVRQDERLMAAIGQAFPTDSAAALRIPPDHASAAPIFIVGMPRSGTTLIEQIVGSHPQVHPAGERLELTRGIAGITKRLHQPFPDWAKRVPEHELARLRDTYLRTVATSIPASCRVTDKMPGNFLYLGVIREIFPNAHVIHVVRDPADTCVSCFTHLFGDPHPYSYDLEDLGRYYRAYAKLADHWRRVLPAHFLIEVEYEALLARPEEQIGRLLKHCGLDWDPACLEFHSLKRSVRTVSASQVRQGFYRTSIGRWKRYRTQLQPLLDALGDLAPAD